MALSVLNATLTRRIGRDRKLHTFLTSRSVSWSGRLHHPEIKSRIGPTAVPKSMNRNVLKSAYLRCIQPTTGRRRSAERSRPLSVEFIQRCGCTHTCTVPSAVLLHVHDSPATNFLQRVYGDNKTILKSKSEGGGKRSETRKRLKRKRPTKRTCCIEPHELTKEGRCKKRRMEYL